MRTINWLLCGMVILFGLSACTPPFTPKSITKAGGVVSYGINEKADNLVRMIEFIDKVKKGEKAKIRIANFWEKKTFIDDLSYDGKKIKWTHRSTPDDKGVTTSCNELKDEGNGIIGLKGCGGKQKNVGILAVQDYYYNKAKNEYVNERSK